MVRIGNSLQAILDNNGVENDGESNTWKYPENFKVCEYENLTSLQITKYAFDKMLYVAREAFKVKKHSVESYWLLVGNGYISDILIPEQIVSYTSVSVSVEAILKIQQKIRDQKLKILGWGHSHADFSVFFSGTDRSNQKTIYHGTSNYIRTSSSDIIKYCYGSTINVHGDCYGVLTFQKEDDEIKSIEIPIQIIHTDKIFDPLQESIDLKELIKN